ncbi:hypothetical protein JANAI62_34680 [Jannaschia pagri]|uniref:Hemin uptake protein HemP n=1 Tax=Jannaschia pagri TaxID=2829797 RepID=A0ABQ4NR03_9RHOB|nr:MULTISPECIES: hemin uptake protein HemP [unclassified Jannaschia]GIT93010.1 hypothetical protein JANAI61_34680 [Jannaschia sp. AI_61]GIT96845.1 hypothetical protein JANAI62_34680 [Jannaschia sp. AI_62]
MTVLQSSDSWQSPSEPSYRVEDLLRDSPTARIILDEQVYILRKTRAGKLILTK